MPRVASLSTADLCPSGYALPNCCSAHPPAMTPAVATSRYNDFDLSRKCSRGTRRAGVTQPQRPVVVVVVVTAGPTGGATVVVCCVVAGLGCSTRSDRTEQADVAASSKIKIDTRMTEPSLQVHAKTAQSRRCCSGKRVLKDSPFRWLHEITFYGCPPDSAAARREKLLTGVARLLRVSVELLLARPNHEYQRTRESRQNCLRHDAEEISVECAIDQIARQEQPGSTDAGHLAGRPDCLASVLHSVPPCVYRTERTYRPAPFQTQRKAHPRD